jgi:hypothetical protein
MYSQQHVRAGLAANGHWEIDVEQAGLYEITLRRWPEELDLPINGAPDWRPPVDGSRYDTQWAFYKMPTARLTIRSARLQIGKHDVKRNVSDTDRFVGFRLPLEAGPARLQTWLVDAAGESRGSYYVSVRLVGQA